MADVTRLLVTAAARGVREVARDLKELSAAGKEAAGAARDVRQSTEQLNRQADQTVSANKRVTDSIIPNQEQMRRMEQNISLWQRFKDWIGQGIDSMSRFSLGIVTGLASAIGTALPYLMRAAGQLIIGFVRNIQAYAEEHKTLMANLREQTGSVEGANSAWQRLLDISNEFKKSPRELATPFMELSRAAREGGMSAKAVDDALRAIVASSMVLGGDPKKLLQDFTEALAQHQVTAKLVQDFYEMSPKFIEDWARKLGANFSTPEQARDILKAMADNGQLTERALGDVLSQWVKTFGPEAISRITATQTAWSNFNKAVDEFSRSLGMEGATGAAENFGTISDKIWAGVINRMTDAALIAKNFNEDYKTLDALMTQVLMSTGRFKDNREAQQYYKDLKQDINDAIYAGMVWVREFGKNIEHAARTGDWAPLKKQWADLEVAVKAAEDAGDAWLAKQSKYVVSAALANLKAWWIDQTTQIGAAAATLEAYLGKLGTNMISEAMTNAKSWWDRQISQIQTAIDKIKEYFTEQEKPRGGTGGKRPPITGSSYEFLGEGGGSYILAGAGYGRGSSGLTPQEQFLYNYHLQNLTSGNYVRNPDGTISTVRQMTVGMDGSTYSIPTIWGGKEVGTNEAMRRAGAMGWSNWPSYTTEGQAQWAYENKLHPLMEADIKKLETAIDTAAERFIATVARNAGAAQLNDNRPSLSPRQRQQYPGFAEPQYGETKDQLKYLGFERELPQWLQDVTTKQKEAENAAKARRESEALLMDTLAKEAEWQKRLSVALGEGVQAYEGMTAQYEAWQRVYPQVQRDLVLGTEAQKEHAKAVLENVTAQTQMNAQSAEANRLAAAAITAGQAQFEQEKKEAWDAWNKYLQDTQAKNKALRDELEKPWKDFTDGLSKGFGHAFAQIITDGKHAFSNLASEVQNIFNQLLSGLAQQAFIGPAINKVGGWLSSILSTSGGGGGGTSADSYSRARAAATGQPTGSAVGPAAGLASYLKIPGASGLGNALVYGGFGMGIGRAAGGLLGMDDTGAMTYGGLMGAGGGALLGLGLSMIPGVNLAGLGLLGGSLLGGLGGSLLGGMFGGGSDKPPHQRATGIISGLGGLTSQRLALDNKEGVGTVVDQASKAASDLVNAVLIQAGGQMVGQLDSFIGMYGRTPRWYAGVGRTLVQGPGGPGMDFAEGTTQSEVIAWFVKNFFQQGVQGGQIKGLSATMQQVMKGTTATTAEELQTDIEFGKLYDQLLAMGKPTSEFTQQIKDMHDQFEAARLRARELGLSVQALDKAYADARTKMTSDFERDIQHGIASIENPFKAAMMDLDQTQAQRVLNARQLGADLTAVEKLNAMERQKTVEQFAAQTSLSLKEWANSLTLGPQSPLAPLEQFLEAQKQFQQLSGAASGGDVNAFGQVQAAGMSVLNLARQVYGATPAFARIFEQVQQTAQSLGITTGGATGLSADEGPLTAKAWTESLEPINESFQTLIEQTQTSAQQTIVAIDKIPYAINDNFTALLREVRLLRDQVATQQAFAS